MPQIVEHHYVRGRLKRRVHLQSVTEDGEHGPIALIV